MSPHWALLNMSQFLALLGSGFSSTFPLYSEKMLSPCHTLQSSAQPLLLLPPAYSIPVTPSPLVLECRSPIFCDQDAPPQHHVPPSIQASAQMSLIREIFHDQSKGIPHSCHSVLKPTLFFFLTTMSPDGTASLPLDCKLH